MDEDSDTRSSFPSPFKQKSELVHAVGFDDSDSRDSSIPSSQPEVHAIGFDDTSDSNSRSSLHPGFSGSDHEIGFDDSNSGDQEAEMSSSITQCPTPPKKARDERQITGYSLASSVSNQERKRERIRKPEEVWNLLSSHCCQNQCLKQFAFNDVISCESTFKGKGIQEQRNWILDCLQKHSWSSLEIGSSFVIKGRNICKDAWLRIYDIKKDRIRRIENDFKTGTSHYIHGNTGNRHVSLKTANCISWLQFFVKAVGDFQPDQKGIHLPSCYNVGGIYKEMEKEFKMSGEKVVSLSQFYEIWRSHFAEVKIPKENRFAKCKDCTEYKRELQSTMNKVKKQKIHKLLDEHLNLVMKERENYHHHRYKARRQPEKYMTVILDGMDNSKTHLPRERRISKEHANVSRLRSHVVGAIVHSGLSSQGKGIFACLDLFEWPHDPNLTVNALMCVLDKWNHRHGLAPVLYLQLDNCVRENKNNIVICFLALMVDFGIFEKIRCDFLPVGHTHEDIDAFFGVLAQFIKLRDAYDIEDLITDIEECMHVPRPVAFRLVQIFDVGKWMKECRETLHEHVHPHCFKFIKNNSKVVMYYRKWSKNEWMGPVNILKDERPEGSPELMEPSLSKQDIDGLKKDIPKFFGHMPPRQRGFWDKVLEKPDTLLLQGSTMNWPLNNLINPRRPNMTRAEANEQISDDIAQLREKETAPLEEIYTGPYRNPARRAQDVQEDADVDLLKEGDFVAVKLENYRRTPVIGKVFEVNEDGFVICYWKGSYNKEWIPYTLPARRGDEDSRLWTQQLPKSCIICFGFTLDGCSKLLPGTKSYLKKAYKDTNKQSSQEQ